MSQKRTSCLRNNFTIKINSFGLNFFTDALCISRHFGFTTNNNWSEVTLQASALYRLKENVQRSSITVKYQPVIIHGDQTAVCKPNVGLVLL